MRILGLEIKRAPVSAAPIDSNRSWFPVIREAFTGAWQRNVEWSTPTVLAHHAVYSCITLIANDIGKLRFKLVQLEDTDIWTETSSPAFSPLLRRPNRYQNHIQFKQWWITSKLISGNTYGLKVRDLRGAVTAIYLLDPKRVQPLVSPDGSIFYQLSEDNLSGLQESAVQVPASEIIHDRMNCLFHPLVGVSPIFAAGIAANIGMQIQENSTSFFGNGSNPGGILTAPGSISDPTAARLKLHWESNYAGPANSGKVAVVGDGLKFEPMRMTSVDAQMIEQLKWTAEVICSTFHVPPHMVGVGATPSYNNIEALSQQYYNQCLQSPIEEMEACFDEGLGLETAKFSGRWMGIELDLDGLIRMDSSTLMETLTKGVSGSILKTNDARRRLNLSPVAGGDEIMRQQQDFPISQLATRTDLAKPAQQNPAPAADDDILTEDEMDEAIAP